MQQRPEYARLGAKSDAAINTFLDISDFLRGNGTALEYVRSVSMGSGTINQVAGTITGGIFLSGVLNVTGGATLNGRVSCRATCQ